MKPLAERTSKIHPFSRLNAAELLKINGDAVNLALGQTDYDIPEACKRDACSAIMSGMNRYTPTQGLAPAIEKVRAEIKRKHGISPEGVMMTTGSTGALMLALMVLLDEDCEALIPDPFFPSYPNLVALCDSNTKFIDTYPGFKLTAPLLESAITDRSRVLILNNPSYPAGMVYGEDEMKGICDVARKHGLYVISVEVHDNFVHEGALSSPIRHYPERTIYINAFSKTYGASGWRTGYMALPADLYEKCSTLQQFSYVCTPAPFQISMSSALSEPMDAARDSYRRKRDLCVGTLKGKYKFSAPEGGFFIFAETPWGTGTEFAEHAAKNGVIVLPGSSFSTKDTHFRISFSASDDNLRKGLEVLSRISARR